MGVIFEWVSYAALAVMLVSGVLAFRDLWIHQTESRRKGLDPDVVDGLTGWWLVFVASFIAALILDIFVVA